MIAHKNFLTTKYFQTTVLHRDKLNKLKHIIVFLSEYDKATGLQEDSYTSLYYAICVQNSLVVCSYCIN